ncbi:MAG: hypothetical protein SGPRY_013369 [Prymnesium sp.]
MLQSAIAFASRCARLIVVFFNDKSILAKRLPHIYGPKSILTYLYRLYAISHAGLLLTAQWHTFAVSAAGFVINAVAVGASLGFYGGLTKLAAIPHFFALGYPAWVTWNALRALSIGTSPVAWVSCAVALLFYVPVLVGDLGEFYQVFGQRKYYVLMPNGVVHPLVTWTRADSTIELDMSVMFMTAVPSKDE